MSKPSLTNCPKLRPSFGPLHCGVSSLLSFTASAVLALFMFFCVEVEHPIDCEAIEHEQLYAQLKVAILSGQRYWFTKEEEQELQKSNLAFYRQGPVEDVLRACYRSAERREECDLLSAADIFQCLKRRNPAAMRGANPASLAQILVAVGIERKHTKFGNVYRVVKIG